MGGSNWRYRSVRSCERSCAVPLLSLPQWKWQWQWHWQHSRSRYTAKRRIAPNLTDGVHVAATSITRLNYTAANTATHIDHTWEVATRQRQTRHIYALSKGETRRTDTMGAWVVVGLNLPGIRGSSTGGCRSTAGPPSSRSAHPAARRLSPHTLL